MVASVSNFLCRFSQTLSRSGTCVILASTHAIYPPADQISFLWKAKVAEEKEDHPCHLRELYYHDSCLRTVCTCGNEQLSSNKLTSTKLWDREYSGFHIRFLHTSNVPVMCYHNNGTGSLF